MDSETEIFRGFQFRVVPITAPSARNLALFIRMVILEPWLLYTSFIYYYYRGNYPDYSTCPRTLNSRCAACMRQWWTSSRRSNSSRRPPLCELLQPADLNPPKIECINISTYVSESYGISIYIIVFHESH